MRRWNLLLRQSLNNYQFLKMRSQSNPIQSNAIEYEQIQPGNIRARIGTVNNGELLDMPEKTRIRSHISKYEQPCD